MSLKQKIPTIKRQSVLTDEFTLPYGMVFTWSDRKKLGIENITYKQFCTLSMKIIKQYSKLIEQEVMKCMPKESVDGKDPDFDSFTFSERFAEGWNSCRQQVLDNIKNLFN